MQINSINSSYDYSVIGAKSHEKGSVSNGSVGKDDLFAVDRPEILSASSAKLNSKHSNEQYKNTEIDKETRLPQPENPLNGSINLFA